jgi:hypothetical protein
MDHPAEEWALDDGHHGSIEEQTGLVPDPGTDHHGTLCPYDAEVILDCVLTEPCLP